VSSKACDLSRKHFQDNDMRRLTLFLVSALCSQRLLAEPAMQADASINRSGQNFQGNLMFNQAAGDAQQQANARAIAIGNQSAAQTYVQQSNDQIANPTQVNAAAHIGGSSFAGSQGIVGINQGAGGGNQQDAIGVQVEVARIELLHQPADQHFLRPRGE